MAFTQATVTHKFTNPDGTAGSGSVVFQLTKRMTNGTTSIVPGIEVIGSLDSGGNLSVTLYANNDPGTVPGDSQWQVDIRVNSKDDGPYFITVPTGGGTEDLGALLPQDQYGG